jgi:uroporphyrinogen-III synthase
VTARAVRPRVLVTRPSADALPLADALQQRGFDVLLQPLLRIQATDGPAPDLSGVQALLFTSANGVRAFARRSGVRTLATFAVGDATAAAAKAEGFVSVTSAGGDVDDLARLVAGRLDPAGGKLLHAAGSAVAGDLAGALGAAGFMVERLQLYTAQRVESFDPSVSAALRDGAVDAALFFSPRSAASFVSVVRAAGLTEACRGVEAFCLSEAVAEAASSVSWRSVAVAPEPNQESLLATLERELTEPSTPDAASENSADIDDLLRTGDATAVIDRFGGIRPMAAKLGVPVTTVQGWKGRGHIPENRFAAVRSAAAAHGVDLSSDPQFRAEPPSSTAASEASRPEPSENAPTAAPAAPVTPMGGSGVAWAALILAVFALAGMASYRYWGKFVGERPPATAGLAARIDKLEAAPHPDDGLRQRMDRMDQRIEAASRQLARLSSSAGGDTRAMESVTGEVGALRSSVEALSQRIFQAEQQVGSAAAATGGSLAALEDRVKALETRRPASGERIAALAVAAGQLETALDSGRPYGGALDGLVALAEGDEAIKRAAGPLGAWAKTGIPTLADLSHRFAMMAPKLRTPAAVPKGGGWADTLRAKVLSLVNMRPVGKDGDSSPVTRAERALARNDLAVAVTALDGISGPAVPWLAEARSRLAADAAIAAVRARIVEWLAAESRATGAGGASAAGVDGRRAP